MQPTTPIGSRTTRLLPTWVSNSYEPSSWAATAKFAFGRPAWMMLLSISGMPTSLAIVWAISSVRASRPAWIFIR